MKTILCPSLVLAALLLGLCQASLGQGAPGAASATTPASGGTLFQNVRIFDGNSATLSVQSNVLVRGNQIVKISTAPIPVDVASVTVIEGGGRVLMPGLKSW